jgi:hypothetical protein
VNSKEENSLDFCPNYVQEFGLPSNFVYSFSCINRVSVCLLKSPLMKNESCSFLVFDKDFCRHSRIC